MVKIKRSAFTLNTDYDPKKTFHAYEKKIFLAYNSASESTVGNLSRLK